MEKSGFVNKQNRKGWLMISVILSCFLIAYWLIKSKNYMTAASTINVQGIVYTSATGTPVEGAIVMIAEGSYQHSDMAAQTDGQGNFSLPNIQIPGTYTLLINTGNESKRVTINITNDSVLKIPL